jgi:NAD(P)-dependent dehydrogenase (short-subunit alcohol dehydrogenase family)
VTGELRPVVVSGASRGLGAGIARHFARRGHHVAVCARSQPEIEKLAAAMRDEFGVEVVAAALSVTDQPGMQSFASKIEHTLGPVGAIVNNAGILGPVGPVDQLDLEAWRHALDVNVVGAVNVTAAFVNQMAAAGGGAVVNLGGAGIGGTGTHAQISAYTTSKGAIVTLTEALSKELAARGVRVNAIAPGGLSTGFMDPVLDAAPGSIDDSLRDVAVALKPAGEPEPIELDANLATLLSFLVSSESAWLTGKLLSARWETVESLTANRERLMNTSLLNLRRIDDTLFAETNPQ